MAASPSAASLILPSFASSRTLIVSKNKTLTLISSLFSSSSSYPAISLASPLKPYSFFGKPRSLRSAFVRNVVVSSEYDQEEEISRGEDAASFSPDLKLFVGNLPFNVDSAQLAGLFERAGNVEMVEVIYDKLTGKSRGFGFVTMSTVEEVEAAAQQFNGYELDGRTLRVNSGPPPRKDDLPTRGFRTGGNFTGSNYDSSNRVYVGNLSWGVDDFSLETLFSEKGKVMEAKVVYDRESGRSRGFGFVTYSCAEEVDSAISSLNGADLDGRPIRVTVAETRPRRQF